MLPWFEVSHSKKGIHVSYRKYALDVLADTGLLTTKSCSTPMINDIFV